jgi:hypothetical protein
MPAGKDIKQNKKNPENVLLKAEGEATISLYIWKTALKSY